MNTKNYLRFGLAAFLASGGSLAFGASQNLDTFTNGGGGLNFNTSNAVNDYDAIGGNVALTDFGTLNRRAFQITGTPGFGNFNNTVNAGLATWTPAVDGTGSATVRYTFNSGVTTSDFGVSGANYTAIELVLGAINGTGSIGIDVYPTTSAGATATRLTGTVPISFADSNTTKLFNVSSLVGAGAPLGTAAIWNSVKMIAFTLTSSTGESSYQINNLGFNVGDSQVPEAKTMVPVIAFVGAAGLMAWRRRAAK